MKGRFEGDQSGQTKQPGPLEVAIKSSRCHDQREATSAKREIARHGYARLLLRPLNGRVDGEELHLVDVAIRMTVMFEVDAMQTPVEHEGRG